MSQRQIQDVEMESGRLGIVQKGLIWTLIQLSLAAGWLAEKWDERFNSLDSDNVAVGGSAVLLGDGTGVGQAPQAQANPDPHPDHRGPDGEPVAYRTDCQSCGKSGPKEDH